MSTLIPFFYNQFWRIYHFLIRNVCLILFRYMCFLCYVIVIVCFQVLKDGLSAVHVPYAYGFAIILLTVIVKAATLPLTKQQVGTNYVNF